MSDRLLRVDVRQEVATLTLDSLGSARQPQTPCRGRGALNLRSAVNSPAPPKTIWDATKPGGTVRGPARGGGVGLAAAYDAVMAAGSPALK